MIRELQAFLVQNPGIASAVDTKVYPNDKVPGGDVLPYLTFHLASTHFHRHLKGSSRLREASIPIVCYGRTYEEVQRVRDAVFNAVGEDGKQITPKVRVFWSDENEDYVNPLFDDDQGIHEITLHLEVRYKP